MNTAAESITGPVSVIVVGASGDLARKKIYPALFSLYLKERLPSDFNVFGLARTPMNDADFRERIMSTLACDYTGDRQCARGMDNFLERCFYQQGEYDSVDAFLDLYSSMREKENGPTDRLYYMAVPSSVFLDVARSIGNAGMVECGDTGPKSTVVVEKPFGRDRASSDQLMDELAQVFTESQTFRIDHYLGKEVVQNLMVLRFANVVFEPLWNKDHVTRVEISWSEEIGLEGRGGYFDSYGIIRDVMQNHLLQIMALTAMEPPERFSASRISASKVDLLRSVRPVDLDELVIGQYSGYRDDPSVDDHSLTPTYARAVLHVDNDRWRGVPFVMTAGKGLHSRMTEIRIRFKPVEGCIFCEVDGCPEPNELVVRVQPDEAIYMSIINKIPGTGMKYSTRNLDLNYLSAFDEKIPDAYESLIMDALRGDKSLFIGGLELQAAWDIFTPVLHRIEKDKIQPEPYEFNSRGIGL